MSGRPGFSRKPTGVSRQAGLCAKAPIAGFHQARNCNRFCIAVATAGLPGQRGFRFPVSGFRVTGRGLRVGGYGSGVWGVGCASAVQSRFVVPESPKAMSGTSHFKWLAGRQCRCPACEVPDIGSSRFRDDTPHTRAADAPTHRRTDAPTHRRTDLRPPTSDLRPPTSATMCPIRPSGSPHAAAGHAYQPQGSGFRRP